MLLVYGMKSTLRSRSNLAQISDLHRLAKPSGRFSSVGNGSNHAPAFLSDGAATPASCCRCHGLCSCSRRSDKGILAAGRRDGPCSGQFAKCER